MSEKKDIKNTKEALVFFFKCGHVLKQAKENDGKVNYMDAVLLMQLVPLMGPAVDEFDQIDDEFKDIDDAELAEIAVLVGENITALGKEKFVAQVMAGLEVAKAVSKFIKTLKK